MSKRNKITLQVTLIVALAALAYSNTLHNPFVFDDLPYISRNGNIRSAANLGELFRYAPTRFLTYFSFFLNFQVSQLNEFSYHVVNLLIHLGSALVVFFLTSTLLKLSDKEGSETRRETFSLVVALLFALHPVQTEAVTYVWQRGASLAAFFYLSSLLCYSRSLFEKSRRLVWAAVGFALLSMFTKQISATLPVAILLIEYFGAGWEGGLNSARKKRLIPMLATVVVVPATMWLIGDYDWRETHVIIPTAVYVPKRLEYFLTEINVLRDYYRLMLFPFRQCVDYDVPYVHSILKTDFLLSAALHLGVLGAAFNFRKRLPLFSFGILFFYLALSVESSVVPLADVQFEHRLYLPSFGFLLAFVTLGELALKSFQWKLRYPVYVSLLVLACLPLGAMAWRRNRVWKTTESFWYDAALKSPNKSRTITSYGRILDTMGMREEAIQSFEKALQIDPRNTMAGLSLALIYENTGQWVKAFEVAQKIGKVSRKLAEYHYAMAGLYLLSGHDDAGIEFLKKAVSEESFAQRSPDLQFVATQAYLNIMNLSLHDNKLDEAISAGKKLLDLSPERQDVRMRVAYALAKRGDKAGAEQEYRNMLQIDPGDFGTLNNLAVLLEQEGKIDQAAAIYDEMIQLRPKEPAPQINRILLMASNRRPEELAKAYHALPELGVEGMSSYLLLGRTLFDKGYCDIAVEPLTQVTKLTAASEKHLLVEVHGKLAECYSKKGNRELATEHSGLARKFAGGK